MTMRRGGLDFLVIGAQRSGTTTLFRYLAQHPQLFVPAAKEVPFFSEADRFAGGWGRYLDDFFAHAPEDRLWGTVTPQYMGYPEVPERLAAQLPNVRMVAILRDPVARAFSHYRMSVRRTLENRPFPVAVDELLDPSALEASRARPTETNSYFTWGEYARILTPYRERFAPNQLLVTYTDTLERNPAELLRAVFTHLGIANRAAPEAGKRYHVGGMRERGHWLRRLSRLPPIEWVKDAMPQQMRLAASFWFEQWRIVPDNPAAPVAPPPDLRALLERHFASDAALLEHMTGTRPPWMRDAT